jgi:hypothetical protein
VTGAWGIYTNMTALGRVTNASVSGMSPGITYYFAAQAIDSNSGESIFSNEINYIVPLAARGLFQPAGAGRAGHRSQ